MSVVRSPFRRNGRRAPTTRRARGDDCRGGRRARPTWVAGRCRRRRPSGSARAAATRGSPWPGCCRRGRRSRSRARSGTARASRATARPASRACPAGAAARRRRPRRRPGRAAATAAPCGRPCPRSGSGSSSTTASTGTSAAGSRSASAARASARSGPHPRRPGSRPGSPRRPCVFFTAAAAAVTPRQGQQGGVDLTQLDPPPAQLDLVVRTSDEQQARVVGADEVAAVVGPRPAQRGHRRGTSRRPSPGPGSGRGPPRRSPARRSRRGAPACPAGSTTASCQPCNGRPIRTG